MARRKKDPSGKTTSQERTQWAALKRQIDDLAKENDINLPGTWTVEDYSEFSELLSELFSRDTDALNLYKPLPVADQFHMCLSREQGLSGSNRAGKTNAASAEIAMAATGKHFIQDKYPLEEVQIAVIGNDERHLSLTFQYLFRNPPFKIFIHPLN